MYQIYISYAQEDQTFALQLADDLSSSGARVWLDVRHARPGRHWTRSIQRALAESNMLIAVLSPQALTSERVTAEWQGYLEAHRPVVPLIARPCDPPGPLRTRRPIDFTRERFRSRAFHELVTRLIECEARIQRTDPVIWTLAEDVFEFRAARSPARPAGPVRPPRVAEVRGLRRVVANLCQRLWGSPASG